MKLTKADIECRVTLAPFEDQPREVATVLAVNGRMLIVSVLEPDGEDDDGLRELHDSQVEGYANNLKGS